jgi:hypothetical protein
MFGQVTETSEDEMVNKRWSLYFLLSFVALGFTFKSMIILKLIFLCEGGVHLHPFVDT